MRSEVLRQDKHCRLCGCNRITTILHLNDTPLEDQFIAVERKNIAQPVYPLDLAICENCGYVFLPYIVNPEASYANYTYTSKITTGLRNHYDEYARDIAKSFAILEDSLVVDLGSNDGSMLNSFKKLGMKVVGVEPASDIAAKANIEGLPTINAFFTKEVAQVILDKNGSAAVVTANYMYANVDDIIDFTKNVVKLLTLEGIFVIQTGYHPEQMKINMFDYIYHEHFSYFTVDVLKTIFTSCGLELIHVKKTKQKGGSIRAIGQLVNGNKNVDASVERLIIEEQKFGVRNVSTYTQFDKQIEKQKQQIKERLDKLKHDGKKIIGFGASHSTTTLLYHFNIASYIEYLVDDNISKQGLYSPGHHIPVYSTQKIYDEPPDFIVLLAWQHKNTIIRKHKEYTLNGGTWIVPLPQLELC
jgi:hypothetical protein